MKLAKNLRAVCLNSKTVLLVYTVVEVSSKVGHYIMSTNAKHMIPVATTLHLKGTFLILSRGRKNYLGTFYIDGADELYGMGSRRSRSHFIRSPRL